MIHLIGERRLLQSLQHFDRDASMVMTGECQQLLALRLRRNIGLRCAMPSF